MATTEAMLLTDWSDIREALELGFTGSVVMVNMREYKGNVHACNLNGNGTVAARFDAFTITPVTGYQTPRRMAVQDILAVYVKDV